MHADTYAGASRPPLAPSMALLAAGACLPAGRPRPLALHLHIPCFDTMPLPVFGGLATYLAYLKREIGMRAAQFGNGNELKRLVFEGVSPAFLSGAQLENLMAHLHRHFRFAADEEGEFEVLADPRGASPERIAQLRRLGFNCISLDVCDDGAEPARVRGVAAAARASSMRSLRVVFGYGLPAQGANLLRRMLATIIGAGPDRVRLQPHGGAAGEIARRMRLQCIAQLRAAGYVGIGGDSFALPGADLAQAHGNAAAALSVFGIPLQGAAQVVGCGVAAISTVSGVSCRNVAAPGDYYALLDRNELPLARRLPGMEAA